MKLLFWMLFLCGCAAAADPSAEIFEMRVRPVLAKNCYGCHTSTHMGGLQLDTREHAVKGGNSGAAIVPGHADQSLLVQAITHRHEKFKMPPGGKLHDDEIATIESWINAGAVWPDGPAKAPAYMITAQQRAFWAFQPVRDPAPPKVQHAQWAKSPIDRFIMAALEAKHLEPVRAADRRDLIRRATFDLTGLPPTPEEVAAFVADRSPDAFAKVVDRLLASPRYGERWGRYWLDIARYSDDHLNSTQDEPYPNAYRYRDWVIQAFNDDMPYDQFVRAQIAGDLVSVADRAKVEPGLGFYALSPEFQDDRVDATTRGFLGLTVACAQCHDHKYDPIPATDYYSLLGIFNNSEVSEYPLAPEDVVKAYNGQAKKVADKEKELEQFEETQARQLADILATKTERFLLAAQKIGPADGLDQKTLEHWKKYLKDPKKEHPFLKPWFDAVARTDDPGVRKAAAELQATVLAINAEQRVVEKKNKITLGLDPNRNDLSNASLVSMSRDKTVFWRELFEPRGVLYHGEDEIEAYLSGEWREHLKTLKTDLAELKKALPAKYAFLHVLREAGKTKQQHVYIRGDRANQGELAPPHFVSILSPGAPPLFTHGSGRLELAEAITDPHNPLTARVMANRIWQHHFGQGIVRTPSNFGELGERPTHPELLDYLAARLVANKWSIKAVHREIMLSAVYQLSADYSAPDYAADPENRLLWRANRQRLDAESLRDALLFVSGNLDLKMGGPPEKLDKQENHRRTVYGFVSRRKLDGMLGLFDFPNPNNTADTRMATNVPLQRLFFMNSGLVAQQSRSLADRLKPQPDDPSRIRVAYKLLLGRDPTADEVKLGEAFLRDSKESWPQYTQVLLSSNEFSFVN